MRFRASKTGLSPSPSSFLTNRSEAVSLLPLCSVSSYVALVLSSFLFLLMPLEGCASWVWHFQVIFANIFLLLFYCALQYLSNAIDLITLNCKFWSKLLSLFMEFGTL